MPLSTIFELRSAFQNTAYRLTVARRPLPEPSGGGPARTAAPGTAERRRPVVIEGTDLDDLIARVRAAGAERQEDRAVPGGLRLVFDLDDADPATRLLQVVSALRAD